MSCKLCGSNTYVELTKLCSNMDIMGPFFNKKESSIVACEMCGHVYMNIDADQDAFTSYYSSEYSKSLSYYEVFGEKDAKRYYADIEKRISKYVGHDAEILEIGGGIGELAYFLKENGYQNITVIEPSKRCINLCEKKGINGICSDGFIVPDSLKHKFDFIILNHTIEHIKDFDIMFRSVHEMLSDDGYVYVEVPDSQKYVSVEFVPYWFFTYEHVFHMTIESFDNFGIAFDFIVSEKKSYLKCNSYYVMYAIYKKGGKKDKLKNIQSVKKAILDYIYVCEGKLKPAIEPLQKSQEPLVLWGVGTSTAQLLNGNFDGCNVVKLVDSNPYRQKICYKVANKLLTIEDPSAITEEDGTILILPLMYEDSIKAQIIEMGLTNNVKSLKNAYQKDGM